MPPAPRATSTVTLRPHLKGQPPATCVPNLSVRTASSCAGSSRESPAAGAWRPLKLLWLFSSATGIDAEQIHRHWPRYLRRFNPEYTFRFITGAPVDYPHICSAAIGDRWTWIVIAAYTQLSPARTHTQDLRPPWEKPAPPEKMTSSEEYS
jgi:hypothetical protein